MRNRAYNSACGAWAQRDTAATNSVNVYEYVTGNPLTYIDPSGEVGILVVIGGVVFLMVIIAGVVYWFTGVGGVLDKCKLPPPPKTPCETLCAGLPNAAAAAACLVACKRMKDGSCKELVKQFNRQARAAKGPKQKQVIEGLLAACEVSGVCEPISWCLRILDGTGLSRSDL